jgi:aminopeptidase N
MWTIGSETRTEKDSFRYTISNSESENGMKKGTLLFIAVVFHCISFADLPTQHFARDRSFDVLHYILNIAIDGKEQTCAGDVTIRLLPLRQQFDRILLDAGPMTISDVRIGARRVSFTHTSDTLVIETGKPYGLQDTLSVTISYAVKSPEKGMYFISPDSSYPYKGYQVWTQGEGEYNHYWFPCYDYPNDRATSEMVVTVDEGMTAISNGDLLSEKKNKENHTATYHWFEHVPHVSYLISLVVGEYVELKDSLGNLPLRYYVYLGQRENAFRSFWKTGKAIEYFSSKTGCRYPWEKYSQTVISDFMYSGEENVSATTLTDNTIHDARAHLDHTSDGLVVHELAHQWFGDYITCNDWSQAWLNEGFATFFENLFVEYDRGHDDAAQELVNDQTTIVNIDAGDRRRPMVCNRYANPMELFDSRIYGKGAIVLSMLREYLGEELFWKAIRSYAGKYSNSCVETNDFKRTIEEATGYNLHWFFDQWVYHAGYPEFEIHSRWDQLSMAEYLTVRQTQRIDSLTGLFKVPVDIELWVNGNPELYHVMIETAETTFTFPAYQQPQLVLFDKGSRILKKVRFEKSADEWTFQLQHATDAVDRLEAIEGLRWSKYDVRVTRALTMTAFGDRFWAVRQDAVWMLGEIRQPGISDSLIILYGDRDSRVRKAAVSTLGNFRGDPVIRLLQHAFEKDSSYAVQAEALRSLVKVDSIHARNYIDQGLQKYSQDEIIRIAALQSLADRTDDDVVNVLATQTHPGYPARTRIKAIQLLAAGWKEREDVRQVLMKLLNDPSYHIRQVVVRLLGEIGDLRILDQLRKISEQETNVRLVRDARDAIKQIQHRYPEQK